jgi:xanthine dehydrogenase molybdenum-binding subunit
MAESVVGKRIPKVDSREKVTGQAVYAGDMRMPGMYYGKVVRCWEYAHAKVKKLDFTEALKVPGVVKCIGPDDITKKPYNTTVMKLLVPEIFGEVFGEIADLNIFNRVVKHQGDAICGVIAKTEEAAERAADKIKVTYEPLPIFMTCEASKAEGQKKNGYLFTPLKPGNLAFDLPESFFPGKRYGWNDKNGKTAEQLFEKCDYVIEETYYVPKQKQCQMENHSYVAHYDERGRLNIWTSTQMAKPVQVLIAELFELPLTRVRLVQTTVGGGFGVRLGMIGEPHACAMAMAVPGHPVRMEFLREEDWVASESRYPGHCWFKCGFMKDGTPVALDAKYIARKGGYYTHGSGPPFCFAAFIHGMYKWQAMGCQTEGFFTNEVPTGAFRGYGNPQLAFSGEQMISRMCKELGIDELAWRKKWHKGIGEETWLKGVTYASDGLNDCIDVAAKEIGWYEKKKKFAKQTGVKRRGLGVAVMQHTSGAFPMLLEHSVCTAKLNEDCTVELIQQVSDLGTGGHTAITQMAADTLGFPIEDIHLRSGDSDMCGFDIGAHASRTVYCAGPATIEACESVKKQLLERAAQLLEANVKDLVMKDKVISVKGNPQKSISAVKIAKEGVYNYIDAATGKTIGIPGQIQGYSSFFAKHCSPPFGACVSEVEVDTETGEVKVLNLVNAHDIGKAIHPPSVEGQLEGGAQQGLGFVLTEEYAYDSKGRVLNNDFTDYKMLGPSDMPHAKIILIESAPDPIGPMGAKSCGESALMGPIGSVANAIYDAIGIQFTEAPVTPEKVLKAIKEQGLKK